jgi:hypothetical protein
MIKYAHSYFDVVEYDDGEDYSNENVNYDDQFSISDIECVEDDFPKTYEYDYTYEYTYFT